MNIRTPAVSLGACLSLALAASATAPIKYWTTISPPWGAFDSDASGQVRLEQYPSEQRFWVRTDKLEATGSMTPYEVWLENGAGSGSFYPVGSMELVSASSGRWDLNVQVDSTTLSVADISYLGGRLVQVRGVGGVGVCLEGTVPGPIYIGDGGGGGGTGGGSASSGPSEHGQVSLQRPDSAPDADAFGNVGLDKRGGRQEFSVDARNLPTDAGVFSVALESGAGTGVFFAVGDLEVKNPAKGRFGLSLEADGAAPAALGVADLDDLAARRVQVVDSIGVVFLWGVLPGTAQSPGLGNLNGKGALAPPASAPAGSKASGSVQTRYNAPQGASTFEVRAKNLLAGPIYSVWIGDGVGGFVQVGTLSKGTFKRQTRRGQSLPLGAGTLGELSGRPIEVRDDAFPVPATVLEGLIP